MGFFVGFSVKGSFCRDECYRHSVPPCSDGRRDLCLCCCPQEPLLALYRTRGICNQVLMDLSISLQDAVLSSPMPRMSQQAGALCRGTVTPNSLLHTTSSPSLQETCNIAPKSRHLLPAKKAVGYLAAGKKFWSAPSYSSCHWTFSQLLPPLLIC